MAHDRLNVALITGAAGGIGAASAKALHAAGFKVVLWDVIDTFPQDAFDDPERVLAQRVDVTDSAAIDQALAAVREKWGGVSVLINNAGISPKTPDGKGIGILDVTPGEWQKVLDINLTSLLTLIQKTAPDMIEQRWGRIVNLSSQAARTRATVPGVAYRRAGPDSLRRRGARPVWHHLQCGCARAHCLAHDRLGRRRGHRAAQQQHTFATHGQRG